MLFKQWVLNLQVKTRKFTSNMTLPHFFPLLLDQLLENSFSSCSHSQMCLRVPMTIPQLLRFGYLICRSQKPYQ